MARRRQSPITWLMPLGTLVQFALPRWFVLPLARLAGALAFRLSHRQRRRVIENQRHLLGPAAGEQEVRRSARRVFTNLATNYADLLRAPVLRRRVTNLARIDLRELDRVLAGGRGCILVTAHIGNWDLAGVCVTALGYPLSAVIEPIPAGWSRTFNRYRSTMNLETVPMNDRDAIARALSAARVFTIVADRDLTGRGLLCPAFDARRSFPRGPAAYALRYRLPLVIGYLVLNPEPGRPPYVGLIEPEVEFKPTGDMSRDIDELTRTIAARLNRVLALYPDQWLVFRANWQ
jgi:KDO2-lipid IV(A) lauroyltransferase